MFMYTEICLSEKRSTAKDKLSCKRSLQPVSSWQTWRGGGFSAIMGKYPMGLYPEGCSGISLQPTGNMQNNLSSNKWINKQINRKSINWIVKSIPPLIENLSPGGIFSTMTSPLPLQITWQKRKRANPLSRDQSWGFQLQCTVPYYMSEVLRDRVDTKMEPKDCHVFIFQWRSWILRLCDLLSHHDCRRNINSCFTGPTPGMPSLLWASAFAFHRVALPHRSTITEITSQLLMRLVTINTLD